MPDSKEYAKLACSRRDGLGSWGSCLESASTIGSKIKSWTPTWQFAVLLGAVYFLVFVAVPLFHVPRRLHSRFFLSFLMHLAATGDRQPTPINPRQSIELPSSTPSNSFPQDSNPLKAEKTTKSKTATSPQLGFHLGVIKTISKQRPHAFPRPSIPRNRIFTRQHHVRNYRHHRRIRSNGSGH